MKNGTNLQQVGKNTLDTIVASNVEGITMDSREIAELTKNLEGVKPKTHAHICRDIRNQLGLQGIGESKFGSSYVSDQNKEVTCFKLDYEQTMILVSGYSIPIRAQVIKRLTILEQARKDRLPSTYITALKALVAAEEEKEQLLLTTNVQEKRIDRLVHNNRSFTSTEIAKEVGRKLREYPLLKTKLKTSDFKRMFRDNYTTGEAFRVAYVNS